MAEKTIRVTAKIRHSPRAKRDPESEATGRAGALESGSSLR
jgi:hypothetical protein